MLTVISRVVSKFFTSLSFTKQTRHWYLLFLVIVPSLVIAFFSLNKDPVVEWQSGQLSDYFKMFIGYPVIHLFFPLFAYSIISFLTLYLRFEVFKNHAWVKVGIIGGFLLSVQYFILAYFPSNGSVIELLRFLALMVLCFLAPFILIFFFRQNLKCKVVQFLFLLLLVLLLRIFFAENFLTVFGAIFLLMFIIPIFVSPLWGMFFSWMLLRQLFEQKRKQQKKKLPLFMALYSLVYGGTVYCAIQKTLEEYSKLPTEPPTCFLATSASYGHIGFVGSLAVDTKTGTQVRVTRQLQYCRFFEMVIQAYFPRFHTVFRKWYNKVGPRLAANVTSPYRADVIYVLFKPVEWMGRLFVYVWPEFKEKVERLYL